jgi:hypothetical protein
MPRIVSILCAALLLVAALPAAASEPALALIVHPARTTPLTPDEVASIYLKKRRFWPDGEEIVPVNLEPGSVLRESFSRRVLGSDSGRLAAYWNQQYFQGVFPPVTLSSFAAVKRYVAAERNAIGYIEASEVDESVGVVLRLE